MAQRLKGLPAMQETWVWSLGWEDTLEKEMATHSSILAWRIPWMEEPGGLQSTGLQRVRRDFIFTFLSLSYHFTRLHIYALIYDICFSLSDLLHSFSSSAKSGFQTLSIFCFQKNSNLKLRTHSLFSDFTGTFLYRKECHWPKGRDPQGNTANNDWNMYQFNFTNN